MIVIGTNITIAKIVTSRDIFALLAIRITSIGEMNRESNIQTTILANRFNTNTFQEYCMLCRKLSLKEASFPFSILFAALTIAA